MHFLLKEKKRIANSTKKYPGFFSYFLYWKKSSSTYKKLVIAFCIFFLFNSSDVFLILKAKNILKWYREEYIKLGKPKIPLIKKLTLLEIQKSNIK